MSYAEGVYELFLGKKRLQLQTKAYAFVPTISFFFLLTFLVSNYWKESLHGMLHGIRYAHLSYNKHANL